MLNSTQALLLFIFMSVSGLAVERKIVAEGNTPCINEANQNNVALQKSFNQCWEPLGMSYLAFNTAANSEWTMMSKSSFSCQSMLLPDQKIDLNQMVDSLNETPISSLSGSGNQSLLGELGFPPATLTPLQFRSKMIRKECIVAAMKRNPGNKGYVCGYAGDQNPIGFNPAKQSVLKYYGKAAGPTAQCVDDKMTDYIHFAVNSAIQCLSGVGKIDSKTVYRKINNESAFNISVASSGGIGIAQMTSIAVKEMTDREMGRGRYVLGHVAASKDPSCNGFKDVASQDLESAPSTSEENRCAWLSPGDGLARNLMYSIGYYLTMRDKYLLPALKRRAPDLVKNEELMNDLTSISYGAEGVKHAKGLLRKFRVGNGINITELRNKLRSNSVYLKAIEEKMKEMTCIRNGVVPVSKECKNTKFKSEDLEGDSCVSAI